MRSLGRMKVLLAALYGLVLLLALETVRVNMRGSVYWSPKKGQPKKRYGPGEGIEIPAQLAVALNLTPLADAPAAAAEEPQAPTGKGKGKKAGTEKPQGGEPPTPSELEAVAGIGPELAAALGERGITTLEQFRTASDEDLLAVPGIGEASLQNLREATTAKE